ncbi:MAG TPA: metallophosphoesterase family protein [Gaiellaceae bacterium]|nr:metallophosphoesterase family protein [Gaiellaceae bacterium]
MRVAALYDVHGNLPALEAVLAEVERAGVDGIVIGGDIASGPPQPREVVELVRALPNAHCIRGNADRVFDEEFADDEGLAWLLEQLDGDQARWLAELPFSVVLDDTLYVHSNPKDDTTMVTELTTDEKLAGLLEGVEQRRVVAGHTHMQLERRVGETLFVNAGSVGWPYEGRTGAYWALLDDGVELRRTDYDLARAAELVRASGHPRAEEIAAENILVSAPREEALAVFGG